MNRTLALLLTAILSSAALLAQGAPIPPGQQGRFATRMSQIVDRSEAQTNNYQLELTIARVGKTARYRVHPERRAGEHGVCR